MSDLISKLKLHKAIFERMEKEVPQSRAHLGGYHTGKRDAYLNVIADLASDEFADSEVQRLQSELDTAYNELDKWRADYDWLDTEAAKDVDEIQRLREALKDIEYQIQQSDHPAGIGILSTIRIALSPQKGETRETP